MALPGETATVSRGVPAPQTIALAGLASLAVAMGIGRFAFTPILPMMQQDVGLTVEGGGWLAAANYFGYLVGALSATFVRISPRAAIRGGLASIAVTTVAMGLTSHFAAWAILRFAAGVASAWVLISVSAWALGQLAPLRRPLLNGTVFAGVGVGMAAAGLVCLALMFLRAPAADAWISLGVVALATTAAAWRVIGAGDDHAPPAGGAAPPSRGIGWDAEALRLVLCYGAFGFGYIVPATFVPAMARQAIADPAVFGWAWPVFGAAAAASTFTGALAARVGGNRRLWMVSHLVMACAVAAPVVVPGMAGIIVAAVGVGGTFVVATMAGMQEARLVRGAHATGLMAALTSAFALGQVAGPLLVSSLAGAGDGVRGALLVAAALLVASAWALRRASGVAHDDPARDPGAAR
jgi:MFS family permease